jgi:hypothetical protein
MEFYSTTEKAFKDVHSRRLSSEELRRRELFTHQIRIISPLNPSYDPRWKQFLLVEVHNQTTSELHDNLVEMYEAVDNAELFSRQFGTDPRLTFNERYDLCDRYQKVFDQSRADKIQAQAELLRLIELNREWLTELSHQIIELSKFNLSGRHG